MQVHDPNRRGHTQVHYPKSRGTIEERASIRQTHGTPARCSPPPQFKRPHKSVGVHEPNSSRHMEAWESITATQAATLKRGSPSPQFNEPRGGMGVHHPNSRRPHPSRGLHHGNSKGRMKRRSPPTHQPNSRGGTKMWESITPIQGMALKHGNLSPHQGATPQPASPSARLMRPHRTIRVHHATSRGH